MNPRILAALLSVPAIGCVGSALATVDPIGAAVGTALADPNVVSWPVALVICIWVLSRELGRTARDLGRQISDWHPPTFTIRLDDTRRSPDSRTRATDAPADRP